MTTKTATKYNVGGVALDRPFKIRRLGHFGFNASDFEASRHFYFDLLGFFVTEPAGAGFFGRHAGDHHSFALFDKKNSTSANTPATTPNIFGKKTTSTRSPGRFKVSPRWPRRANIFTTSASRSCAKAGLEAAVRNFISTCGRRTNKSSNSITASSRSAGTATPARSHAPWHAESAQRAAAARLRTGATPTSRKASAS